MHTQQQAVVHDAQRGEELGIASKLLNHIDSDVEGQADLKLQVVVLQDDVGLVYATHRVATAMQCEMG